LKQCFFFIEASRCAYKRNIILSSVRQHNLSNKALFQNNNVSNKALFQNNNVSNKALFQNNNVSNKALFQNNNVSNKALFQITSQTKRYSKQQCLKQGVIPKYAQIKVPYTSPTSITTQKKMQISRIREEIKFL